MYVTDVPVVDRLTDDELEAQEKRRNRRQESNVQQHNGRF